MEKILRFWTDFLVQLEAGKRVIAIFIVITGCLSYALININNKYDKSRVEMVNMERSHTQEIIKIKDSSTNIILRNTLFYNEKIENIYRERLEKLNEVERGYKTIKRINDKIVSDVNK